MVFWKRLTRVLQIWLSLPQNEKLLLVEAWLDLLFVSVLLRTPLQHRLMQAKGPIVQHKNVVLQPDLAIRLVNAACSFHVKKMTCLERALVARRVLWRRGKDVTLRIGVNRVESRLEAHAWLEDSGLPLDHNATQYVILRELGV